MSHFDDDGGQGIDQIWQRIETFIEDIHGLREAHRRHGDLFAPLNQSDEHEFDILVSTVQLTRLQNTALSQCRFSNHLHWRRFRSLECPWLNLVSPTPASRSSREIP